MEKLSPLQTFPTRSEDTHLAYVKFVCPTSMRKVHTVFKINNVSDNNPNQYFVMCGKCGADGGKVKHLLRDVQVLGFFTYLQVGHGGMQELKRNTYSLQSLLARAFPLLTFLIFWEASMVCKDLLKMRWHNVNALVSFQTTLA